MGQTPSSTKQKPQGSPRAPHLWLGAFAKLTSWCAGGDLKLEDSKWDFKGAEQHIVHEWEAFLVNQQDKVLAPTTMLIPITVLDTFKKYDTFDQSIIGVSWEQIPSITDVQVIVEGELGESRVILRAGDARQLYNINQELQEHQPNYKKLYLLAMNNVGIGYTKTSLVNRPGFCKQLNTLKERLVEREFDVWLMEKTAEELGLFKYSKLVRSSSGILGINFGYDADSWLSNESKSNNEITDSAQYLLRRFARGTGQCSGDQDLETMKQRVIRKEDLEANSPESNRETDQDTARIMRVWDRIHQASKRAREELAFQISYDVLCAASYFSKSCPHFPCNNQDRDLDYKGLDDVYKAFLRALERCHLTDDQLTEVQRRLLNHHMIGLPVSPVDIPLLTLALGLNLGIPVQNHSPYEDRVSDTALVSHIAPSQVWDYDVILSAHGESYALALRQDLKRLDRAILVKSPPILFYLYLIVLVMLWALILYLEIAKERAGLGQIIQTEGAVVSIYLTTMIPLIFSYFYSGESLSSLLRGIWTIDSVEEVDRFSDRAKWSLALAAYRAGGPHLIHHAGSCIEQASQDGIFRLPNKLSAGSLHLFGSELVFGPRGEKWVLNKTYSRVGRVAEPEPCMGSRSELGVKSWHDYSKAIVIANCDATIRKRCIISL